MFKLFKVFLVSLLILWGAGVAWGAATCVVQRDSMGQYDVYTFEWTSHTDGAVASGTCDETTSAYLQDVTGIIVGVKFQPDATTAPTDAYDVVLNTPGGADVLMGNGANLTNDDSLTTQWQTPRTADSGNVVLYQEDLDLVITNAGSSKLGKIFLTIFRF